MCILVIGAVDDAVGQAVALLRAHGALVGAASGLPPTFAADRPDVVPCPLEPDVAALIAAIGRHGSTPPVIACGRCERPGAQERPPSPAIADRADRDEAAPPGTIQTAGRTIKAVERDMILDTLRRNLGNRTKTASVLGISIRTLRNKLHEYERDGTRIPRPVVVGTT